jgi:hypothetical protein
MCNTAEHPSRLPLHLAILLLICICSLVGHIISDSQGANNYPAIIDLVRHGGHVCADEECDQDDLVFPSIAGWLPEYVSVPPAATRTVRTSYLPISPLLPPPNF